MTKAEVQSLIDTNLASGTTITAAEHRAVETEILNYAEKAGAIFVGTLDINNPSTDASFSVGFPYSLPDSNYVVMATLVSKAASASNDLNIFFAIRAKNENGFSVVLKENSNTTQDLELDYVVFKK